LPSLGALGGTFRGYQARTRLVKALQVPDVAIALVEDLVAIAVYFTQRRLSYARTSLVERRRVELPVRR
jgi:hypothetical protein